MLTILCTSKPADGLFFYSYEYCQALKEAGVECHLLVIPFPGYSSLSYINAINQKYMNPDLDIFNGDDLGMTILIMGRSMMTLPFLSMSEYDAEQQFLLKYAFNQTVIAVYSENHPKEYPKAVEYFRPQKLIDLCDTEVYPNGVGEHFEKRINFSVYKPIQSMIKYKYLFLGTNKSYYDAVKKHVMDYPDHGIIAYDEPYIDKTLNNIIVPTDNLLGQFDTYVYTKESFDPAPRLIQECKYFGKDIIYARDKNIVDGGSVYYAREIKEPDLNPILRNL